MALESNIEQFVDLRQVDDDARVFIALSEGADTPYVYTFAGQDFRLNTFTVQAETVSGETIDLDTVAEFVEPDTVLTITWPGDGSLGRSGVYFIRREPNEDTSFMVQSGEYFYESLAGYNHV